MLKIAELESGIRFWRKTKWPQDFHEYFYKHELPPALNRTSFEVWWGRILPILTRWKATRPKSSDDLTRNARDLFPTLRIAYNAYNEKIFLKNDIAEVDWDEIAEFTSIVYSIKKVNSPVFTSKLCHFISPCIFPVVDNKSMGNPFQSYEEYFKYCKNLWANTVPETQNELIGILTKNIVDGRCAKIRELTVSDNFPIKCKLIELCIIGRKNH
ncbi:hypothetical protein ACOSOMT5_P2538 [Acidiphilium sp. MT5]